VERGADINRKNHEGLTVLYHLLVHSLYWTNDEPDRFAEAADVARHMIRCTFAYMPV
jgi:hypothetical protein